ncbi:MAG: hypothetical protein DME33_15295 [Verrucomicrobia bacterium]|nr:MAG: hypothetical protein DME33_15295 [Verrucomicrobiota bacterium]
MLEMEFDPVTKESRSWQRTRLLGSPEAWHRRRVLVTPKSFRGRRSLDTRCSPLYFAAIGVVRDGPENVLFRISNFSKLLRGSQCRA